MLITILNFNKKLVGLLRLRIKNIVLHTFRHLYNDFSWHVILNFESNPYFFPNS